MKKRVEEDLDKTRAEDEKIGKKAGVYGAAAYDTNQHLWGSEGDKYTIAGRLEDGSVVPGVSMHFMDERSAPLREIPTEQSVQEDAAMSLLGVRDRSHHGRDRSHHRRVEEGRGRRREEAGWRDRDADRGGGGVASSGGVEGMGRPLRGARSGREGEDGGQDGEHFLPGRGDPHDVEDHHGRGGTATVFLQEDVWDAAYRERHRERQAGEEEELLVQSSDRPGAPAPAGSSGAAQLLRRSGGMAVEEVPSSRHEGVGDGLDQLPEGVVQQIVKEHSSSFPQALLEQTLGAKKSARTTPDPVIPVPEDTMRDTTVLDYGQQGPLPTRVFWGDEVTRRKEAEPPHFPHNKPGDRVWAYPGANVGVAHLKGEIEKEARWVLSKQVPKPNWVKREEEKAWEAGRHRHQLQPRHPPGYVEGDAFVDGRNLQYLSKLPDKDFDKVRAAVGSLVSGGMVGGYVARRSVVSGGIVGDRWCRRSGRWCRGGW